MKKLVKILLDKILSISIVGLSAGVALALPSQAKAADLTFRLTWDGTFFFNTASAVGYFTIASNALPNPGNLPLVYQVPNLNLDPRSPNYKPVDTAFNTISPIENVIKELTITVTDSGFGDGTYTKEDFGGIIWNTNGVQLDFTKELVGQPTVGLPWGTIVSTPPGTSYSTSYTNPLQYGGDFNVFDPPECVPTGVQPFVLATCSGQKGKSVLMRLTSFTQVPVPSALLGVVAAGGLMAISKRKKKSKDSDITK